MSEPVDKSKENIGNVKEGFSPPRRVLYNLTLYKQDVLVRVIGRDWNVEEEPRLVPVQNPQDWSQIKRVVKLATGDIPPGSAVLIGGMTQIAILISQLDMFELFYIKLSYKKGASGSVPSGICPHIEWTKKEQVDIRAAKVAKMG